MTNSPLVTFNPISQDNSGKRTHDIITPNCVVDQRSVADKTRETGCSFAIGFENNTLIVQNFPKRYMNG